jgi:mannose-6-phosphate isomerase
MQLLRGVVHHYDWGDQQTIPEFLGVEPDAKPWAELWFGTHRSGPSLVKTDSGNQSLSNYAGELSFLVKIIAAAKPLSLQTHPTDEQAQSGYQQENEIGISLDSPLRIVMLRQNPNCLLPCRHLKQSVVFAATVKTLNCAIDLGGPN